MNRCLIAGLLFWSSGCDDAPRKACEAALTACTNERAALSQKLESERTGVQPEVTARQLAEARMAAYREVAEKVRRVQWSFDPGELSVHVQHGRLVIELPNRVLFQSGRTKVLPQGLAALEEMATILRTLEGRHFLVAGHTDNVAIGRKSKRFRSNWELSVMRAIAVVEVLQREGVAPQLLGAVGYGEHQPIASNAKEAGRRRNRRTEVIIMPTAAEIVPLADEIGGEPTGAGEVGP